MALTEIDIISGISSLISIIIFTFLGLIIISKYFKYKKREFLLFGITMIGLAEPHYGPTFSVLSVLNTGQPLSVEMYLFISLAGNPITLVCFVLGISDLLYKKNQKSIFLFFMTYGIIFEIYLIYFLINDPSMVGVSMGVTDAEYTSFTRIYMISVLLVLLIGGTLFAQRTLRSDNPEINLKGKFLLPAFYIFVFSAIVDSVVTLNAITLPLNRIALIISGVLFYLGFILPNSVKNFFLKEE